MDSIEYVSTRGHDARLNAADAIARGLAPDGGLYMPTSFPAVDPTAFADCATLAQTAARLIAPFVQGSVLAGSIEQICQDAFNFPTPVVALNSAEGELSVLELFHGPTAAFKDVGARFLAACMEVIEARSSRPLNILVATSGDTGGAVAAAFHGRNNVNVDVFYPRGQV